MSRGEENRKGNLANKLARFSPEPPELVWEGVQSKIQSEKRRRILYIILSSAAAFLLAITVGIHILFSEGDVEFAVVPESELNSNEQIQPGVTRDVRSYDEIMELRNGDQIDVKKSEPRIKLSISKEETVKALVTEVLDKPKSEQVFAARLQDSQIYSGKDMEEFQLGHKLGVKTQLLPADTSNIEEDGIGVGDTVRVEEEMTIMEAEAILAEQKEDQGKSEESEELKGRWLIGAVLAPQYSYRDVASPNMKQNMLANQAETGKITYSTGVNFSYVANDRLTIESGVYYNKLGVNIGDYSVFGFLDGWQEKDMVYAPNERADQVVGISNSIGTVVTQDNSLYLNSYGGSSVANDYHLMSPENMSVNGQGVEYLSQTFEYLEVPFNIRYKIYDKELVVQLIGGVSTNFMVHNSIDAVTGSEKVNIGQVEDVRLINYSGNAGLGFLYSLYENLTLSVEPRFKYYLHSVNASYLPSTRPYAFGIQTGLSYRF